MKQIVSSILEGAIKVEIFARYFLKIGKYFSGSVRVIEKCCKTDKMGKEMKALIASVLNVKLKGLTVM